MDATGRNMQQKAIAGVADAACVKAGFLRPRTTYRAVNHSVITRRSDNLKKSRSLVVFSQQREVSASAAASTLEAPSAPSQGQKYSVELEAAVKAVQLASRLCQVSTC